MRHCDSTGDIHDIVFSQKPGMKGVLLVFCCHREGGTFFTITDITAAIVRTLMHTKPDNMTLVFYRVALYIGIIPINKANAIQWQTLDHLHFFM